MSEATGPPTTKLSDLIFPAYRKAWKSRKQNLVIGGSKGSGKSKFAALRVIMDVMENPGVTNALVIRKVFGTCRDSVYTDLLWAIDQLGVTEYWQYTVSPMQLIYKPTGQMVLFRGLDDPLKLASIMVRTGLILDVWFEEAFEISNYEDVLKVMMSIRGEIPEDSKAFKRFIFTFNPWSEHHWLKKEFFDVERDDTLAMITTYKDNLKLGEDDVLRYEKLKETNPRAARVICDGEWGRAEGTIYNNFFEEEFDPYEILKTKHVVPTFGLDFGFSISFNAFVASLVDMEGQELWIYDEWYCNGVSNLEVAKAITEMGYAKEKIWADAAEPKSIYDLKTGIVDGRDDGTGTVTGVRYSLPNIQQALKGRDSVRQGISTLQGFRMHVHPKCRNTLQELANYAWKMNKDGTYMDEPEKEWDHCLAPGTMILTDHGEVPIEDIKEGDMILTHFGYRLVTASGITQFDQPIWRLETDRGALEGTWNHQIVTLKGVKYLRDLTDEDVLIAPLGEMSFSAFAGRLAPDEAFKHIGSDSDDAYRSRGRYVSALDMSQYVSVRRVFQTDRVEDVYDLTVADAHDFYANGILVLNCMDALRYSMAGLFMKGHGAVVEAKGIEGARYQQRSKRVFATVESTSR